jgi:predicted amidohydrolase
MSLGGFQERVAMDGDEVVDEARLKEEEVDEREVDNATATTTTAQPEPAQKVFNAHVVVDPLGRIAAVYRKIHLFDVDVPNGPVLLESRTTTPGDRLVVVPGGAEEGDDANSDTNSNCPCGPLALTTCYDLRFPEMFAALAFGNGQQQQQNRKTRVIAVPSAFTKPTGTAHWELLLRARAVETQCYVVAAAQAGKHNAKRESYGDAMVVDPWGEVAARVEEGPLATGVAFCDLSAEKIEEVRRRMPIAEHREAGRRRWLKQQ